MIDLDVLSDLRLYALDPQVKRENELTTRLPSGSELDQIAGNTHRAGGPKDVVRVC